MEAPPATAAPPRAAAAAPLARAAPPEATAPTVGADVPEMTIPVPAAVIGVPGVATIPIGFHGFRFALGLGIAITRNAVHTDTTAIGAGEVKVKLSRTV